MFKFFHLIILFVFLGALIVSCEKPDNDSVRNNLKNVLRCDVNNPFTSLNPTKAETSGSNNIFPLLYSKLFIPDADGKLQPDLAVKWIYDSTSFTWTIHLRNGARFHNRQPVSSKTVKHSIEKGLKRLRPSLFYSINRISLVSDIEFSIHLKHNDPEFAFKIWDTEILPHPLDDKIDFYNHPIGSGPFKFKQRTKDKEVILEANEDYYNGRPLLDSVVFYFQPDKEKSWNRFLAGETDIVQEISPKNYEMMKQYEDRYYFDHYILNYYSILLYNTKDPLFVNPKVRMGLSHAIDREYIVKNILRGYGKVAVGPMGLNSPFHNPAVKAISYNPQKGLELLQDDGWSYDQKGVCLKKQGIPFEFTIIVFEESQIEKRVARYIQLSLNDLGIKVHLKILPLHEVIRSFSRNNVFQAVLAEFKGAFRNPEFLKQQWSGDSSQCAIAGCFEHPEVTRLIDNVPKEKEPFEQKQLLYEIETLLISLQPGTFLFQKTAFDAMSKKFYLPFPFSLTYEGSCRLRFASIKGN
jgi:peptide/nickel transport system substrate-binding protein